MKKLMAILFAAVLSASVANAQIEFSAGYANSWTINSYVESDGYRSGTVYAAGDGFYLGVTDFYGLGNNLKLSYSIVYSYLTGKEKDFLYIFEDPHYDVVHDAGKVVTDEHYLTVPVMVEYNVPIVDKLKFFVAGGLGISYCLSSKSYSSWTSLDGHSNWNVDHFGGGTNYNGYRRFDILINGGAGFEVMSRVRVLCTCGYGLLDRSSTKPKLHRFSLQAGLSYLF